jgi:predicted AlkP superfamily pyrophosphatase or phosphodiesterase
MDVRYLKNADQLHLKIPNLRRLIAHGVLSDGVIGVVPTITWPSHTSVVTGVPPEKHGILTNDQPGHPGQRWWFTSYLKSETLWQATMRNHLKTATIYWPVTVGAEVDYNCPEFWETRSETQVQFDPIARRCTPGLVDRIESVYPSFTKALWDDRSAMEAARYLLEVEQPSLTLVHIADLDAEEHETGALSIYSRDTLENADELIGSALQKLPPHAIVAILSDHGFETADHVVRPRVMVKGPVEVRYGLIGTTDKNVAAALRKAIVNKKSGIAREVAIAEVYQLAPDLKSWVAAFDTAPGYIPSDETKGAAVGLGNHRGVHGLWPTRPNYRATFLLSGEGVRMGRMEEISMLDIAPTFAEILEVRLPAATNASLWPKLQTASTAAPSPAKPKTKAQKKRKR